MWLGVFILIFSALRWWCEQGSLWQAPTGDGARRTRSWSMPLCGQANVATSSTRAPSALPSRLKPEVEVLSLRLTTPSGGGSTRRLRGDGHWGLQCSYCRTVFSPVCPSAGTLTAECNRYTYIWTIYSWTVSVVTALLFPGLTSFRRAW